MERIVNDFFKFELGLIGIIITIPMLCFCSCTTTEYVTVERVQRDTTYVTKHQRDSIWLHDSVFVKEWTAGDTVYRDRIQWHTKYIEHEVHDTVYHATHDTIPQPYPVIKEVEKQLSRRHKAVYTIGVLTMMGVFCWLVWYAVKILRRFGILKI